MDTVLTTMFYFWISLFLVYFLVQRGLWIFSDVAKGTVHFMLEKFNICFRTKPTNFKFEIYFNSIQRINKVFNPFVFIQPTKETNIDC